MAIEASFAAPPAAARTTIFSTYTQRLPLFSTTQVHHDYIDCVRWIGDSVLSKSTKNRVALWAPDSNRYKGAPLIQVLSLFASSALPHTYLYMHIYCLNFYQTRLLLFLLFLLLVLLTFHADVFLYYYHHFPLFVCRESSS